MTKKKEETNKIEKFLDNHPILLYALIFAGCGVIWLILDFAGDIDFDTTDTSSAVMAPVPNSKLLEPASSSFTEGGLSRFVEIVATPAYLVYDNDTTKSGVETHYTLKVKVRLKRENAELASVDANDIAFTSDQFMIGRRGLTLILKDDDNITLNKNDYFIVADEDVPKLKKLLKASKGTEEILTFVYTGSPDLLEEATLYAPSVTASLSKPLPTTASKTLSTDESDTQPADESDKND